MSRTVIENPIINSPFAEPARHFHFDDDGITDQIVAARRPSAYFMPIPQPRKKVKDRQQTIEDWRQDRIVETKTVNAIRERVKLWREGGYQGVTRISARLLEHWKNRERARRLFFCQIEALETVIYITEAAKKLGDAWIENDLQRFNQAANPELFRMACKMATGSGKTVVMAMLIAWQALNKLANPQDARFSDSFLIVTPGITIRDRLRVLLPSDPQNYYKALDIAPGDLAEELGKAKIVITNFHAFRRREKLNAGKLTKALLTERYGETPADSPFLESEGEMVRRVCRDLGNKKNIVVLNDEAHHCYRHKPDADEPSEKLTGDDRKEAERREEQARIWISGLEAVKRKIGVKAIYDLSATPFFLRGSGYPEGSLFNWVVSDFSLIDAIEAGIVKVPRVPIADDSLQGDLPTYRELWFRIREELPKKGRGQDAISGEPRLPGELEGALNSLYHNYAQYYRRWESNTQARADGLTPPVFIVVCNNTNVSKLVFDYISGWEKSLPDGSTVAVQGKLALFSNVDHGQFVARPNTILVDSEQLESGEAMSADFKQIASREIDEFKADYRARFPGRDTDNLTDEDLLREVMNTVGKQGKLGENIRCVVSVSMLTEGWDANTVTHILGVRAFGTQLLCEQVVGRGLRRMSYTAEKQTVSTPAGDVEIEAFPVEYAEVYGVPFSFIPSSGAASDPKPGPIPTHVRALDDRRQFELTFPRIEGYRYELPAERLTAGFTAASKLTLSTRNVPTTTEVSAVVGSSTIHGLDSFKRQREQTVVFEVAKAILEKYFPASAPGDPHDTLKSWLFPDLLAIVRRWLGEGYLVLHDKTFPQLLLMSENKHDAADRIYKAIVESDPGEKRLLPIPKPYDTVGSTRGVSFDTVRSTYRTKDRCHVSHVVCDTESWEQKLAQTLEEMDGVLAYAKNHNLGFAIPYTIHGRQKSYVPDFICRLDDGHDPDDPLNLIVEVTGERDEEKEAKVSTAKTLWVPAVNNAGLWGRWDFFEVRDPWNAGNEIREYVANSHAVLST